MCALSEMYNYSRVCGDICMTASIFLQIMETLPSTVYFTPDYGDTYWIFYSWLWRHCPLLTSFWLHINKLHLRGGLVMYYTLLQLHSPRFSSLILKQGLLYVFTIFSVSFHPKLCRQVDCYAKLPLGVDGVCAWNFESCYYNYHSHYK